MTEPAAGAGLSARVAVGGPVVRTAALQHSAGVVTDARTAMPVPGRGPGPEPAVVRMLAASLGASPAAGLLRLAPSANRMLPGWDGEVEPLAGVVTGAELGHAMVLSVPPLRFDDVRRAVDEVATGRTLRDRTELGRRLPAAVGAPGRHYVEAALRWTTSPSPLPEFGLWHPPDDPLLPDWLQRFPTDVLVAFDSSGRYQSGVGIKRHNRFAHEIAVGTAPELRGRGFARALVAQAARRILDDGAVPLYLHDMDNSASARVADAAGFPDRGWRWIGLSGPARRPRDEDER